MPQNARPLLSASSVAAALAITPAARNVTGVTRVPRLQIGIQAGEHAEGHPRFGDRLPGPPDLRDLDEVIHQREPSESGVRRGESDGLEPAGRVVVPAKPGDLQYERQLRGARTLLSRGLPAARRVARLHLVLAVRAGRRAQNDVPAFGGHLSRDVGQAAKLRVEHRRGHRAVAGAVARPA